ncbi:MAG: NfeD family protein [Micavibrio aeruginosavorus]|uniref:NfeD family protein n=1 Tax=Micavibrio aeruginosavorus TaxID=349221 RepID=A0A7T5R0W5_9BACT|nr:MAG: NfeD family protein [Micavibrio aeruginosavorus]
MAEFFSDMTFWHWFILGGLFMIAEVMIPGAFFLWPGIAALVVGLIHLAAPELTWAIAVTIWSVLSLVTIAGWLAYRRKNPGVRADNGLNERGSQYIGRVYVLTKPLENGKGEIKAGDTVWLVSGTEALPAGTNVKVTGADGSLLKVEKA